MPASQTPSLPNKPLHASGTAPRTRNGNALENLLAVLRAPELAADLSLRAELWPDIRRQAEIHRFAGWLAHAASPYLPSSQRAWRDQVLMTHHRGHAQRLASLRRLIDAFGNEGIPCVSLKGPLLAERFYPIPFLRPSNDLDLLVRETDIGPAARLMFRLGFRLEGVFPWRIHRYASHHLEFRVAGASPEVEVHYAMRAGRSRFESPEFIERSVTWKSASGFEASVLSPADEAFHSCVHAAGHAFHRLRWVYDFLTIANRLTPEDRSFVRTMAKDRGQTGPLVAACMASREFFGESPAIDWSNLALPWLFNRLAPRHIRRMVERVDGTGGVLQVNSTFSEKLGCRIDLGRVAGSPVKATLLAAAVLHRLVRTRLYTLGTPLDLNTLASTLPD